MIGMDMYTEPGHATLRRMMKDDPEWALNRLVSEKQRADDAEAALAKMTDEKDCCVDIIRDYEQASEKGMDFAAAVTLKSMVGHYDELQAKLAAAEAQVKRLSEQFKVAFRLYLQDADYDLGELLEAEGAEYVDRKQEP